MKKKSVNPAMAMMAARAMRTPAARPTPMGAPQVAPNALSTPPGMPPMPGMKKGGMACKDDKAQDKAMIKKAIKQHDMQEHKGGKGTKLSLCGGGKAMKKYASGGRLESKGEHADQKQSKRGAMMVKMASGGYTKVADGIAKRGKTKGKMC